MCGLFLLSFLHTTLKGNHGFGFWSHGYGLRGDASICIRRAHGHDVLPDGEVACDAGDGFGDFGRRAEEDYF